MPLGLLVDHFFKGTFQAIALEQWGTQPCRTEASNQTALLLTKNHQEHQDVTRHCPLLLGASCDLDLALVILSVFF